MMSDLNAKVLTSQKLEKFLAFLGIYLCRECGGKGRITRTTCSCCAPEIETCPDCKGEEFMFEEYSPLKSLFEQARDQEADQEPVTDGVGLCD